MSGSYVCKNEVDYSPTKRERNLLHLAFCKSLESKIKLGKHAAFILDSEDNILGIFINTHLDCCKTSIHAEQGCIASINGMSNNKREGQGKYKMLVVRGNFEGRKSNSRPCIDCYKAIIESGIISEVIYSFSGNKFKKMYL